MGAVNPKMNWRKARELTVMGVHVANPNIDKIPVPAVRCLLCLLVYRR